MAAAEANGKEDGGDANRRLAAVSLVALGVVYGDIGTSPLYALRVCFYGESGVAVTPDNVLGVLSLVFWSLIVVISGKYLLYVMRADNRGEGGIIALAALLNPWRAAPGTSRYVLMALGLFGAALLYGDGMITPAISVLSAVEGLAVAHPALGPGVIPVTIVILVALFSFQRHGTSKVGSAFGPVMLAWFATLALLGIGGIVRAPQVLAALGPWHAATFLAHNGLAGFLVLGAVFLVVTGGEALYADMGHFGRAPIRLAWFVVVLPALVLNYFGQGALLLTLGTRDVHPFFELAPRWATWPLLLLATAATIIASQAVISGTFSLTRQAIRLGQMPRLNVVHTDGEEAGQVYVPAVNWALMAATVGLVLGFRHSGGLANAYGFAVSADMVITTVLAFFVARRFGWHVHLVSALTVALLCVDLSFFGSNVVKIATGGWLPLLVAATVFTIMTTWRSGRALLARHLAADTPTIEDFLESITAGPPVRVPGTAVFLTGHAHRVPAALLHHLEHTHVLHEQVVLLTVTTLDEPRVPASERFDHEALGRGFHRVRVRYGFMQTPNVPVALRQCEALGLDAGLPRTSFYVGRETLIPSAEVEGMALWRERLFAFLSRNSTDPSTWFGIPPDRVVELGIQIEI